MKTESDVITDENNGVAEWKDKYGVNHATQSDASKRPTLKKVESRRELLDRLNREADNAGTRTIPQHQLCNTISEFRKLANHQEEIIARMRSALINAKEKLGLYRCQHSGDYIGGIEYTQLIRMIDEALADAPYGGER